MANPIKVLVVEDSPTVGTLLSNMIKSDPALELVGLARDGAEAIRMTSRLRPNVITMDVNMPHVSGLEATEYIMAHYPTPILVLTASLAKQDVNLSIKMLSAGALEIMEKPGANEWNRASSRLLERIKLISRIKVITHLRGKAKLKIEEVSPASPPATLAGKTKKTPYSRENAPTAPLDPTKIQRLVPDAPPVVPATPAWTPPVGIKFAVVAIAASTGGPPALAKLFKALPRELPAPLLVVQHIPSGFGVGLAEWLNTESNMPVKNAEENEKPLPGHIYLPADDSHLAVHPNGLLHLSYEPARFGLRPSADITFDSLAKVFPGKTLAVILTGMGRDGTIGMRSLKEVGGYNVAQDEATSVIFGMPKSAIEAKVVDKILPLDQIAPFIKASLL
jgi:two-component system, chemotaxis family, protein-glutamate methylesterase/glutaminase